MKFCPIVPTSLLNRVLKGRDLWFVLAQVEDPMYVQFHRRRPSPVEIILDNGAYEGKFDHARWAMCIELYTPEITVLPDIYLGDWQESADLSLGALRIHKDVPTEWMFVPQARPGDLEGCVMALKRAARYEEIKWIGLPRCLATDIARNSLARVWMADLIRTEFPDKKIHALGLVDGNYHELCYLAERGVESCDASSPVWRGIHGLSLDQPRPNLDIDFGWKPDPDDVTQFLVFEENLRRIDECLNRPTFLAGTSDETTKSGG